MMNIKIKKIYNDAKIPTRGSECAAGYDLYAYLGEGDNDTVRFNSHASVMVETGVAITLTARTVGAMFARSGLASKQGLAPANCVGKHH